MNPATAPITSLGLEVPVTGIERALKDLWDNDQASTKATLINLIIFSTAPGSLSANNALVSGLTRDHACRVLLIEATPGATTKAWITAHCHLSSGSKSICSEQIAVQLDRNRPGLARNTLLAHLLSDLPVILWWQGELDHAFEPALFHHLDRLLVDSSEWPPGATAGQIQSLLAAQAAMARPFSIHDLAWTRTYQFRIAVAALFDHPHAQRVMSSLVSGEVVVAPGQRATGALLVAWIAHALGWRHAGTHPDGWAFTNNSGSTIRFDCRESATSATLGKVSLKGDGTTVEVTRTVGQPHLQARILDAGNLPPLVLPADPDAPGDLVASMLSRGGKNSLYSSVLPGFLAMVMT